jgi:hypothetical protein
MVAIVATSVGCQNAANPSTSSPVDAMVVYTLRLSLSRDPSSSPNPVKATATVTDGAGVGLAGLPVQLSADSATVSSVTDLGNGSYTATIVPQFPSGELPITAQLAVDGHSYTDQRTAVILPGVDAAWDQPEAVRGAVNTPGYQDGAQVSPDGHWLIVTDYSPIDMLCCSTGCGTQPAGSYNSSYCQTSLGPYAGPLRPDFPGANRITSTSHIVNSCPSVCFTSDGTATGGEVTTVPLPPLGSYLFERQADGSFDQPAFIGLNADGCSIPEGFSFTAPPSGNAGNLVFAMTLPFAGLDYNIYTTPITLGATNILASLSCPSAYAPVFSGVTATQLAVDAGGNLRGNPGFRTGSDYFWFDDDGASVSPHSLYFSSVSGSLPDLTFSPLSTVAAGTPADGHTTPFFDADANTLYYSSDHTTAIASATLTGSDPGSAASWAPETSILTTETWTTLPPARANSIGGIGQPSTATPADTGKTELYFVYVMWTGTGTNFHVGVVHRL